MTIASRMVSRRALLGAGLAGGAALVSGCGPPEQSPAAAADVLADQLRADQAAARAYDGLSGLVPGADRPVVERLATRARARERRVRDALRQAGGTPPPQAPAPAARGLEAALAGERRALEVHVAGIGLLGEREWRALLADLVVGAAEHESALLALLGRPAAPTAFPGQPA